jgi:GT2 family glycosyltransferase
VRREAALGIGGYDPAFVGSALAEDMDFCRRLILAGHGIWYDPEAWIIHLALKRGGCAVDSAQKIWPEWHHSGTLWLYAFRHGFKQHNFLLYVWMALRHGPLRRENVMAPLRWPSAWYGFFKGMIYGWRHRKWLMENG